MRGFACSPVQPAAMAGLALLVLAGCADPAPATSEPAPVTTAAPTPSVPSPEPTPTGPAADAIRGLDPQSLPWQWFDTQTSIEPVDVSRPDEYNRSYAIGEPVYSDADSDGLEDMAVSIAQLDGNGYREQWHIWLATADGSAQQVLIPIAWSSRCGDTTESITATDGGFTVHEYLREPVMDDHLACAETGTFEVTRGVGVLHDGDARYPVDLTDPRGFGGVCPTHERTETGITKVWGSVGPDLTATLSIDGEEMYLILTHPHTLTQDVNPKRLASVWPPDGSSDNRICVWIDPVRFEGSGE